MTAQEVLESACQAIRENAEANCPFHTHRPWVIEDVDANRIVNAAKDCTCHATIDAAAEAMLAAAQEVQRQVRLYGPVDAAFKVEATIKRLLEGEG